jgi:hypothetical protein
MTEMMLLPTGLKAKPDTQSAYIKDNASLTKKIIVLLEE